MAKEKEYYVVVKLEYGTNITARSKREALELAKDYAAELEPNTIRDNVEVEFEEVSA